MGLFQGTPSLYGSNPVIPLSGAPLWRSTSISDLAVGANPYDATKGLMFVSGTGDGTIPIGRFDCALASPYSWSEHGGSGNGKVVLAGSAGSWDDTICRVGSWVYNAADATVYIYYRGSQASGVTKVGLVTTPDLVTYTKYAGNPILTPAGTTAETYFDCPVAFQWGGSWWMLVAVRTSAGGPPANYSLFTGSDGKAWSRVTDNVLPAGIAGPEAHGVYLPGGPGGPVYLVAEGTATNGSFYCAYLFAAPHPAGPYAAVGGGYPLLQGTGTATWPADHVATPKLALLGGNYLLFFTGSSQSNVFAATDLSLGAATLPAPAALADSTRGRLGVPF